jgi:hypothetical protein
MVALTNVELAANQRAIDALKPGMIKKAQDVLQGKRIPDKRQFTSLVEAGVQASCAEELILFIQYKNAKDGSRSGWSELAKPLTDEIESLKALSEELADDKKDNYLQLTRLFLGYLMWAANVQLESRKGQQGRRY